MNEYEKGYEYGYEKGYEYGYEYGYELARDDHCSWDRSVCLRFASWMQCSWLGGL